MKKFLVIISLLFITAISYSQSEVNISNKKINEHGIEFYLHTVQKGETLYRISKAYNVEINDILYFNPELFNGIKVGQVIKIPSIKEDNRYYYHLVKKGETVFKICNKYGITSDKLYEHNPELKEKGLIEGQIIKIPKNQFAPKPKEFTENQNSNEFIYHTVQAKETLYSISKKYGVSINEILDLNPFLKDQGLRKYDTIKIPKKEKITTTGKPAKTQTTNVYVEHTVKKGETLYSISKTYGVSISNITSLNPEVEKSGLKTGQVIKIPTANKQKITQEFPEMKSDTTIPPQNIDSLVLALDTLFSGQCDTTELKHKEITILIAMPFANIKVENDPKIDYTDVKNFKNYPTLEFYEGFLFALDSLKKKGLNIKLYTRDISDTSEINNIISKEQPSLIYTYGPAKLEKTIINYASRYGIPVIDIFRSNLKPQYQKYFRLLATKIEKREAVLTLISHLDTANIIFLYPSKDSMAIKFLSRLTDIVVDKPNQILKTGNLNENEIKNIKDYLTVAGENYLIIWSFDEPQVTKYINKLSLIVGKEKIDNLILISLPDWKNYKHDYENLHRLQTLRIRQNYTTYDSTNFKEFALSFKNLFQNIPTRFSLWGFDLGYYFTTAYAYFGDNFDKCLNNFELPLIETEFKFINDENGYHNQNFYIIQLTREYDEIIFLKF